MDSHSTQLPPSSSTAPAAIACPQSMLLAPYGGGIEEDCNITGDTKTIAAAATSKGQRITVSLRREPYPSMSRICLRFLPGTGKNRQSAYSTVIAAHGGSVLVHIASNEGYLKSCASDYFVYRNMVTADDPSRPPSLYLLPRHYTPSSPSYEMWRLGRSATGLLCHGKDEFVVAELKIVGSKNDAAAATAVASPIAFELHLFRYGEWCVKLPRIIGDGYGRDGDLLQGPLEPEAVVSLGDGVLCWVVWHKWHQHHRLRGVIFSNVLDESPVLRYVPYPEAVNSWCYICPNARGALMLVRLSPRCCSHCGCSQHATAIDTWTLNTDGMAWVFETETNMVNSSELWALEPSVGYARVHVVPEESSAPTEEEDEHVAERGNTTQVLIN